MLAERKRLLTAGSRVRLRVLGDERLVSLVRRGDPVAFEVLYERHSAALLSFCAYMLGSRADAEDSVQATFVSAYRALRADRRQVSVRPWLFTIARNHCLDTLRARRETVELNGELAPGGEPAREFELREEVAHIFEGLRELPERQRAALALAELHGLSQADIGTVLGVESHKVKGYVYQARSNLLSDRRAREADCCEIQEEIATARGAALLRGRLRRHIRCCADCRTYADGISHQRRQLAALLPLVPSLMVKARALEDALAGAAVASDPAVYGGGAAIAGSMGAAAEVAGGGIKALVVKAATGLLAVGAATGAGASILGLPATAGHAPRVASAPRPSVLTASLGPAASRQGPASGRAQARGGSAGERRAGRTGAPGNRGRAGAREGRGQREASERIPRERRAASGAGAAATRERRSRADSAAPSRASREERAKEGLERAAKRAEARRERQQERASREAARQGHGGAGSPEGKEEEGTEVGRSPAPKEHHKAPKEQPKGEGEEEVPKVGGAGAPKGKERHQHERERAKRRRERERRRGRRSQATSPPG